MKKHNRLISVLLCFVMIVSCFSMAIAAEEDTVTVTYAIVGEGVYHTQTLPQGSSIGSTDYPENPVREGKIFTGWFYNTADGRVSVDTDFVPENDMTLLTDMEDVTAVYTVTYAIPGQGVYHIQTIPQGSSIGSVDYPSNPSSSEGCFDCWFYNENGGRVPVTADFIPQGDITLLSQWKASHNWATATCTEPRTCLDCGFVEGEALGHTWTEATCTAPKTCSVCGATEGEALGHTWTEATCTAPKTCSVCGATEGEALGHTPEADDGDCTTGIHCSVCGVELTPGNASHTGGTATCTEQAKCDVCGTAYGELAPHTWTAEYTAEDADAEKHYHVCTVCGAKDAGEAHVWNVEAATEETDKHCEVCGYVAEEQLGHVHAGTLVPGVDPTCTGSWK